MDAEAMRILLDELPTIDITVSSQTSPELADGLMRGRLDLAFLRPGPDMPELEYKIVTQEPRGQDGHLRRGVTPKPCQPAK